MAEVMIQEKEDAAAWLLTLHGEELMQEAAVPKKIVAEDFFCGGTAALYNPIVEWMDIKAKRLAESEGSANKNSDFSLETPSGNLWTVAMKVHVWRYKWLHRWFVTAVTRICIRCCY